MLLSEARKALATGPAMTRDHEMEIERLSLRLRETQREAADERQKKIEAETKERAAIAQQSSIAKSKHELDVQVEGLRRAAEEEKQKRVVAENRAMGLDKRLIDLTASPYASPTNS
jgi:hypothetical protein